MKTIAIDCRFVRTVSGLGRFTRELVAALVARRNPALHFVLIVPPGQEAWLASLPQGEWSHTVTPVRHYSLAEHVVLPRILRAVHADLLFSPHFNAPWRCPVPSVVTVHDLILHHYPNAAPLWKRMAYRSLLRHSVYGARAIMTVSSFVADELICAYGQRMGKKIHVVPEGVSPLFRPRQRSEQERVLRQYGIDPPFTLYVGNAKEHKNVPFLLRAWEALGRARGTLVLISSGKEAERLRLPPNVLRLDGVPDDDLAVLYSAARCFVTPSLYEGYCLPLAEALACGCPAIAMRRPPMDEVSQGRAVLCEETIDSFAAAIAGPLPPPTGFVPPSWSAAAEKAEHLLLQALS